MVATIVFNQSNIVADGNNNTLVYKFPNSVSFPNHEIAVQSVNMFYSWTNINPSPLANQTFTYQWAAVRFATANNAASVASTALTFAAAPTNGGFIIGQVLSGAGVVGTPTITAVISTTSITLSTAQTLALNAALVFSTAAATTTITIPTGLYEISDINNYLQYIFIQNGHYLVNAAGQNVYYAEMLVNPSLYAVQVNTFPIPLTIPAGYTIPAADPAGGTKTWAGFPTATFNPVLTFPANFNKIIGFAAGFATAINTGIGTNLSYTSTTAPQVQPNSNVLFGLSNISNKYAAPSSVIFSVAPSVAFGQQINEKPPEFSWNKLLNGTYNELRLQILGTDFSTLKILDPNMTIILVIKDKDEYVSKP
jgi:hypothetical protein